MISSMVQSRSWSGNNRAICCCFDCLCTVHQLYPRHRISFPNHILVWQTCQNTSLRYAVDFLLAEEYRSLPSQYLPAPIVQVGHNFAAFSREKQIQKLTVVWRNPLRRFLVPCKTLKRHIVWSQMSWPSTVLCLSCSTRQTNLQLQLPLSFLTSRIWD